MTFYKQPLVYLLCLASTTFAQRAEQPSSETYPKNTFKNPLEVANYLSGNFGELRNNHFHTGLDIKTQQREGLKVNAAADGYISRINISATGYGNALYIDHPNGYTTVYAHLQKFTPEIEQYVREQQYKNESFQVELYPKSDLFKLKQGDLIALSGNSGGSGGPHLHFEIRETKTEEPVNPLYFGYSIPDTRKPSILGTYAYAVQGEVNGQKNRVVVANNGSITASGEVGFGVKAYDKQNGAENNNGVHSISVIVNDEPIYTFTASRFAFTETRAINSVCDYSDLQRNNSWVYQTFVTDGNPLRVFSNLKNNGVLQVEGGKEYAVKITVSDYAGNISISSFKIIGKSKELTPQASPTNLIHWNKENQFKADGIDVFFPKNIFYEDFDLKYSKEGDKHRLGDFNFPIHAYYTLAIDPASVPTAHLNKAIIVRQYQKRGAWQKSYEKTELKNGKLFAQVRDFGTFSIELDHTKPTITPLNIKENSIFTASNGVIRFTIHDAQSGIKEYKAFIDGKWVLAEYDQKIKRLSINLNKEEVSIGEHALELHVKDEKNNIATYSTTFKKNS